MFKPTTFFFNLKKSVLEVILVIIIFTLISIFSLWRILVTPGTIGMRVDWSIPPFPWQLKMRADAAISGWAPQSLGIIHFWPSDFIELIALSFISSFMTSTEWITKSYLIFVFVLSGSSMYFLSKKIKLRFMSPLLAALFYSLTPLLFNLIVNGGSEMLSYALTPLVLALYISSLENNRVNTKTAFLTGLSYAIAIGSTQYLAIIFSLILLYSLFQVKRTTIMVHVKTLIIIVSLVLLVHSLWLIPLLMNYLGQFISYAYQVATQWMFSRRTLLETFTLRTQSYRFFEVSVLSNEVLAHPWFFVSILVPVIAFSTIILKRKDKIVLYFSSVTVLGLFLANGAAPPLGDAFLFLMSHVPFMSLWKEPYHLMVIPALGYATMLGFFVESLIEIKHLMIVVVSNGYVRRVDVKRLIVPAVILIILMNAFPFFTGGLTDNLQTYHVSPVYENILRTLSNDKEDYRVLWLPMTAPMNYTNQRYPGYDPIAYWSPKPSFSQGSVIMNPSTHYQLFLASILHENVTANLGYLLGFANVKYVVLRNDITSMYYDYGTIYTDPLARRKYVTENRQFEYLLQHQSDIFYNGSTGPAKFFMVENFKPHIYASNNSVLVVSDLSYLVRLGYSMDKPDLLFFTPQLSSDDLRTLLNRVNTVYIQSDNFYDLVFSLDDETTKIEPGAYAKSTPFPRDGWVSVYNSNFWYNWRFTGALRDVAFTYAGDSLHMPFVTKINSRYDIWAKVYQSQSGGSLTFLVDDQLVNSIDTSQQTNGFTWMNIGQTELNAGDHLITIENEAPSLNAVSLIVIIANNSLKNAYTTAVGFLKDKTIILLEEAEDILQVHSSIDWLANSTSWKVVQGIWTIGNKWIIGADGILEVNPPRPVGVGTYEFKALFAESLSKKDPYVSIRFWQDINNYLVGSIYPRNSTYAPSGGFLGEMKNGEWTYLETKAPITINWNQWYTFKLDVAAENVTVYVDGIRWMTHKLRDPVAYPKFRLETNVQAYFASSKHLISIWLPTYDGIGASGGYLIRSVIPGLAILNVLSPIAGIYDVYARINAPNGTDMNITTTIGTNLNSQLIVHHNAGYRWYHLGSFELHPGLQVATIFNNQSNVLIDQLELKLSSNNSSQQFEERVAYLNVTRSSPTEYDLAVNANKQFFLVFSESYDPLRRLHGNGAEIKPIIGNSFANAYYVGQTGQLNFRLYYIWQNYRRVGMYISAITIISSLVVVFQTRTRLLRKLKRHGVKRRE